MLPLLCQPTWTTFTAFTVISSAAFWSLRLSMLTSLSWTSLSQATYFTQEKKRSHSIPPQKNVPKGILWYLIYKPSLGRSFFFFVLRYKDKFNIRLDFRSPPLDDTIKHHNVRPLSIHIVILVVEGKHQMVAQCNGPNRWTIHEVQLCFALTFSVFAGNVQSKCSKYAFTH